ncbi:MAG: type II toxin-antitoxin system CcdA family antitoxin [Verrucomicrobiaceae bacterium]|nr:type II toxin-antitoxin system CcdA family antitoxin [Verrucomicrobiaceae bacterium]
MKDSLPPTTRGGQREGSGRPSQGKIRVNLTLNEGLVQQARTKEKNLSALLDRLLADWLQRENS